MRRRLPYGRWLLRGAFTFTAQLKAPSFPSPGLSPGRLGPKKRRRKSPPSRTSYLFACLVCYGQLWAVKPMELFSGKKKAYLKMHIVTYIWSIIKKAIRMNAFIKLL